MTYIIIIASILIAGLLMLRWLGKSQVGTLTLFHSTFAKSVSEGRARKDAYRIALDRIAHRYPIGSLSDHEKERVLEVFSMFSDPVDVKVLLREALVRKNADLLGEPYISNLERAGREKGLIDE